MIDPDVWTLVEKRLEQAESAISDARFLFQGGGTTQGVVNRAYYGMFYAALALLQSIKKTTAKHSGVISLFDMEFVLKGVFPKEMSGDFHRAYDLRHKSDYFFLEPMPKEQSEELLDKAARFVQKVKDHFHSLPEKV